MKKFIHRLSQPKLLLACAVAGLASGTASAQVVTLISPTVQDGGFESITAKSFFGTSNSPSSTIPYWAATLVTTAGASVGAPDNSGAEPAAPGTPADNSATHSGAAGSFFQPGASTAFNLGTGHTIQLGDVYTVSWFGRLTGVGGQQTLTLFTQSPSTISDPALFTYAPSATVLTAAGATDAANYGLLADRSFKLYTATYTAQPADVGLYMGLTIGNSGTAFIGVDDFTLTVSPVPEPSTYAFLGAGLVGLLIVSRTRRARAA